MNGQPLTFDALRRASQSRRDRWHTPDTIPWLGVDWSNAMAGEAGEACNVVKKLRRWETGMGDVLTVPELQAKLAEEIADTIAYADLLAAFYGFDLGEIVARKFNAVSRREGYPERLPLPPDADCRRDALTTVCNYLLVALATFHRDSMHSAINGLRAALEALGVTEAELDAHDIKH